ncbi:MAG: hypothetical protein Q7T69_08170 [Rhodoferax sp.]|nr:hypothetical protein [Rhodoferax sp.]
MIQSFLARNEALAEFNSLRIAFKKDGSHIGLLFRLGAEVPSNLLHLAFHHLLYCEQTAEVADWDDQYAVVNLAGFDVDERIQLAVWLKRISKSNGRNVPYGLKYSGQGYFDATTGKFISSETGRGLTCSTFVLAVFIDFGFNIVDCDSWPVREDDTKFQRAIMGHLQDGVQRHLVQREHMEAQQAHIGTAPRFRPLETAAGCAGYLGTTIEFASAELISKHLELDMIALG